MFVMVCLLAVAHALSPSCAGGFVAVQSPPLAIGVVPSEPPAPPFQRKALIEDTTPPFVNVDTTKRSPSTWFPVTLDVPFCVEQPAVASWRNQKPTFASPFGKLRSWAK
jgi:hypothetical protein